MTIVRKVSAFSLVALSLGVTACDSDYSEFTAPPDSVVLASSYLHVDSSNLDGKVFIPNQTADVELDVTSFVWDSSRKQDVKDITLSAQVTLNSEISRAGIKSLALIDKKGNSFPLSSFAIDSNDMQGIYVDCKDKCATYKIESSPNIKFVVIKTANISGLTALEKN